MTEIRTFPASQDGARRKTVKRKGPMMSLGCRLPLGCASRVLVTTATVVSSGFVQLPAIGFIAMAVGNLPCTTTEFLRLMGLASPACTQGVQAAEGSRLESSVLMIAPLKMLPITKNPWDFQRKPRDVSKKPWD